MPSLSSVKFSKYDQYNNPKFVSKDGPNFNILKDYATKLIEKKYNTYLPIYYSDIYSYTTITFKKNPKFTKLSPRGLYDIDFTIKKIVLNDKIYINCYINTCKLITKASDIDEGEELEL